jgi:acetyl-CoA carboxylase carboxyl transferase subunit beta
MSWFKKLLPPKIRTQNPAKKTVPEGLWSKCPSCDAVLYFTDLEKNLHVCPKCGYHNRLDARQRSTTARPQGGSIGFEVVPVDSLKFKDNKRYVDRLEAARKDTGETDALVVVQGRENCPVDRRRIRVRFSRRVHGIGRG